MSVLQREEECKETSIFLLFFCPFFYKCTDYFMQFQNLSVPGVSFKKVVSNQLAVWVFASEKEMYIKLTKEMESERSKNGQQTKGYICMRRIKSK